MEVTDLLFPVFALVLLTFGMAFYLLRLRVRAVKQRQISIKYFRTNSGGEMPETITRVSHNYDNLLALPVLFYVLIALLLISEKVELLQLLLAWLFVASRYVHSYIHITYNNVIHRMLAFVFGALVLIAMWLFYFFTLI